MQIRQTAINARSQNCDVIGITTYVTARLALLVVGATNHYKCNEERCIDTNAVPMQYIQPLNATRRSWWQQFDSILNKTKSKWPLKWNFCIDLRMNSVSHNSLLQGLRLLNRHMLQTTQLVINSLRELALPEYKCMNGKNTSRSLWEACIDLIPCQNQFGPRSYAFQNVGASGASGFHQQCLPVTEPTYPLRHHQSTSNPCTMPTSPPLPPHILLRRTHQFSL